VCCAEELERPAVLGACALSAFPHGTPVDQAGTGRRGWKQTASSLVAVAGLDPAQTGVMSAALSRLSYTAGWPLWCDGLASLAGTDPVDNGQTWGHFLVGVAGFEPATSSFMRLVSCQTALHPAGAGIPPGQAGSPARAGVPPCRAGCRRLWSL
jgi:hypothetical protein